MTLRMWMYDLAREQAPDLEFLRRLCTLTLDSGYNALGMYLEHRFAYPSTPWAHGIGAVTPEMIRALEDEFPALTLVPFINLLSHVEGFLYTEEGSAFAEERFTGMQADPTNERFVALAQQLIDDTVAAFRSPVIHIGGDETWQLGAGEGSRRAMEAYRRTRADADAKALLYGNYFAPLARRVLERGRRPAMWGDILLRHPQALALLPRETLIFDWQYFGGPGRTAQTFLDAGFEAVVCPAIHTYNATWMHLPQSEENIRQHSIAAAALGTGICVTTWECGLFGNYETVLPSIRAAGAMIANAVPSSSHLDDDDEKARYATLRDAPHFLRAYGDHEEWARLMGIAPLDAGGLFAFSGVRSVLRSRLLLYSNPFLLWLRNRDDLLHTPAYAHFQRALQIAPDDATRGIARVACAAIEFVRIAQTAREHYAAHRPQASADTLERACDLFTSLADLATGSMADVERCRIAAAHVRRVIERIREHGNGSLGYLPSFETITHPKFVPHDQGNWWLINRWGNE